MNTSYMKFPFSREYHGSTSTTMAAYRQGVAPKKRRPASTNSNLGARNRGYSSNQQPGISSGLPSSARIRRGGGGGGGGGQTTPNNVTATGRPKKSAGPFSVQSYTGSLDVAPAPSARAFSPRLSAPSDFRYFYERGDFPIAVEHDTSKNKIAWKVGECFITAFILRIGFI